MELDEGEGACPEDVVVAPVDLKVEVRPPPQVVVHVAVGNVPAEKCCTVRNITGQVPSQSVQGSSELPFPGLEDFVPLLLAPFA